MSSCLSVIYFQYLENIYEGELNDNLKFGNWFVANMCNKSVSILHNLYIICFVSASVTLHKCADLCI